MKALHEGTGNFYSKNASKIFAFAMQDDVESSEMEYEDTISNVRAKLKHLGYTICDKREHSGGRSYEGRIIAYQSKSKKFNGEESVVSINAIVRHGYYVGANFDWELEVDVGSSPEEKNWADVTEEKLVNQLEDVFAQFSLPLVVIARFSNGETMYAKYKQPKHKTLFKETKTFIDQQVLLSLTEEHHPMIMGLLGHMAQGTKTDTGYKCDFEGCPGRGKSVKKKLVWSPKYLFVHAHCDKAACAAAKERGETYGYCLVL